MGFSGMIARMGSNAVSRMVARTIFLNVATLFCAVGLICTNATPSFATGEGAKTSLKVVASIPPLAGIAAGVMGELGRPTVLVSGAESPHTAALTTREARALAEADVVLWIGEDLESFLAKPLGTLSGKASVLTALDMDVTLLPFREGGLWGIVRRDEAEHGEVHEHEETHRDGKSHEHGENHDPVHTHSPTPAHNHSHNAAHDPHIWMDPDNARVIAKRFAEVMTQKDPENAEGSARNLHLFEQQLMAADTQIAEQVRAVRGKHYMVYHDGYQYFEKHYALPALGSVTKHPDIPLTVSDMARLRSVLAENAVECLFSEPQFPFTPPQGGGETRVRTSLADPLGEAGSEGTQYNAYVFWLQTLANTITGCLAATHESDG